MVVSGNFNTLFLSQYPLKRMCCLLDLVPFNVSSSCRFRVYFLSTITSGVFNWDKSKSVSVKYIFISIKSVSIYLCITVKLLHVNVHY